MFPVTGSVQPPATDDGGSTPPPVDLTGYVTAEALTTALAGYATTHSLTTALGGYATTDTLTSALANLGTTGGTGTGTYLPAVRPVISQPGVYLCTPMTTSRTRTSGTDLQFGYIRLAMGLSVEVEPEVSTWGYSGQNLVVNNNVTSFVVFNNGVQPLYLEWNRPETLKYVDYSTTRFSLQSGFPYPIPPASIVIACIVGTSAYIKVLTFDHTGANSTVKNLYFNKYY
jgi:hypothetical protein